MKTLLVEDTLYEELKSYANELNKNIDEIVKEAISNYFDKLDEVISDKVIDDIKNGKEKLYSLDEIKKELGV